MENATNDNDIEYELTYSFKFLSGKIRDGTELVLADAISIAGTMPGIRTSIRSNGR